MHEFPSCFTNGESMNILEKQILELKIKKCYWGVFFKKYFSYYLESVFEIVDLQIVVFTDTRMLHRRPNDFFTKKIGYILNNEAI